MLRLFSKDSVKRRKIQANHLLYPTLRNLYILLGALTLYLPKSILLPTHINSLQSKCIGLLLYAHRTNVGVNIQKTYPYSLCQYHDSGAREQADKLAFN